MSAHQEYGKASEVITYTAYGGSININHTAVICRPVSTSIIQLRIPEHTWDFSRKYLCCMMQKNPNCNNVSVSMVIIWYDIIKWYARA